MTGETPISLNKLRKTKARASATATAARNRVVHGRSKAEKQAAIEHERAAKLRLDGARREP